MTSDGITVLQFAPEKETLRDGEATNLLLRIQNTGDAPATGITAKITRAEDMDTKSLTPAIDDLEPPDVGFNQPGGIKEVLWTLTTKETSVPKTQEIAARIDFNYLSTATKEIPILTSARARELTQSGRSQQPGGATHPISPIDIDILSKDPIELGEGKTSEEFTFKVYLTNKGSGVVETAKTTGKCATERLDCIDTVQISANTKDKIKCEGVVAEAAEVFTVSEVKLWQGKDATITCQLKTDLGDKRETQIVLKAVAKYRYHYDTRTSVLVEPKR